MEYTKFLPPYYISILQGQVVISIKFQSTPSSRSSVLWWVEAYGLRGEGLVRLIGEVVCLLCCAAGPLVRYRGQWMAAYRATVSSAHANQLPPPGLWSAAVRVNHLSVSSAISSIQALPFFHFTSFYLSCVLTTEFTWDWDWLRKVYRIEHSWIF